MNIQHSTNFFDFFKDKDLSSFTYDQTKYLNENQTSNLLINLNSFNDVLSIFGYPEPINQDEHYFNTCLFDLFGQLIGKSIQPTHFLRSVLYLKSSYRVFTDSCFKLLSAQDKKLFSNHCFDTSLNDQFPSCG